MRDGMLDVVLTSPELSGAAVVRAVPPGAELTKIDPYHPPLDVKVTYAFTKQDTVLPPSNINTSRDWNFAKADFLGVYQFINNIDWTPLYALSTVNAALDFFYNKIYDVFDQCIPKKERKPTNTRIYPVYYNKAIIQNIQLKARVHRSWKRTGNVQVYEEFKILRSKLGKDIKVAYNEYCKAISEKLHKQPLQFWSHVNSLRNRGGREPKVTKEGKEYSGEAAASAYAEHFESVFLPDRPALDPNVASAAPAPPSRLVDVLAFTERDLLQAVRKLRGRTSPGPDAIPPYIIKGCIGELKHPILYIFNLILSSGDYPSTWKESRVTPIPKKGCKTEVENYRPVAILCAMAKIFEMTLHASLLPQCAPYLTPLQHAFLPKRSVVTNLVTMLDFIAQEIDTAAGNQVDVIYLDFQKAFDRVDNDTLLIKLSQMGFVPRLLKLFASIFRDRQQFVKYGPYVSRPYGTHSGISQGSNLGPFLFVILINDLPDVVTNSKVLLFADDVKLMKAVNSQDDSLELQRDINALHKWSQENKLYFNPSKCEMMTFSRSKSPYQHQYTMEGAPIARVWQVRDLGVEFDAQLTFRPHLEKVTKTAFQRLGFVLRNSAPLTYAATETIYKSLVRSILENAAVAWSPHQDKYILAMEQVQKRFLRSLYKKKYTYYPFMYPTRFLEGYLGYDSLELRRNMALAKFILSIIRNKVDCLDLLHNILVLFVPNNFMRARRHMLLAEAPSRTNLYRESPVPRGRRLLARLLAAQPGVDLFADSLNTVWRACKSMAEIGMKGSSIM
ncbi:unnamed protein product [Plutella xylostella]|uniref:(diamondback moth) hypothetical protein n=2 Tax=Plutella xylostella TaxID=51655 RepID=A0A8S4F7D2_PLUXY|nr:unnamed protein product [Plutella xylostella]